MRNKIINLALLILLGACSLRAQTTITSTKVIVNTAEKAEFCFGPASSPCIGQTVVFVNYPDRFYQVIFNYAAPGQQGSAAIPLTYTLTPSSDPDHDSNRLNSVVVDTTQSGTVGSVTVQLNPGASFQSEQIGSTNRNETLGGQAMLTIGGTAPAHLVGGSSGGGGSDNPEIAYLYPCTSKRISCLLQ